MQMKEREMKMDEFDSKRVEEAFSSSGYELSKTFYTSYDEKK